MKNKPYDDIALILRLLPTEKMETPGELAGPRAICQKNKIMPASLGFGAINMLKNA